MLSQNEPFWKLQKSYIQCHIKKSIFLLCIWMKTKNVFLHATFNIRFLQLSRRLNFERSSETWVLSWNCISTTFVSYRCCRQLYEFLLKVLHYRSSGAHTSRNSFQPQKVTEGFFSFLKFWKRFLDFCEFMFSCKQ